ncbi:MAG: hypothetical protein AAFP90_13075 [Planctomycetota bacterium]
MTGTEADIGGMSLGQLTFTILYKSQYSNVFDENDNLVKRLIGWQAEQLNTSQYYRDANGKVRTFRTADGKPYIGRINESGGKANFDAFFVFRKHRQRDFNEIVST